MKNSVKMIAAVVAMAAMMVGCAKMELDTKAEAGDNTSAYGYIPGKNPEPKPQGDTLLKTKHYGWEWIDLVVNYEYKSTNIWKTAGEKDLYGSSMTRPIEVKGGAKVEKEVSSEAELNGVKYTEGQVVETASRWNANDWYGTQNLRTLSSKLSNGKYGADFELTYSSSDAHFVKDSLAKDFPDVAWSHSVKDTLVKANVAADNGGYYKVNSYIAMHTLVANVVNDFVKADKEAQASKKFEVRDTLSLKFFVAPDPEDQVIDTIGVGTVERRNGKLYGIGRWYARHTLIDPVLVNTQEEEFNASLDGNEEQPVYASNANFATNGEGWKGVGSANYYDNATNGDESFNNTYAISAAKGMTMSYEGIDIVFNANMVVSEDGQTIGAATLKEINGQYYNVYPYSNKVNGVYTVSVENQSASINLSATSTREIRVKAKLETKVESKDYSFTANVNGNTLLGTGLNTVKKAEYVNGVKKDGSEQTFTQEKIIKVTLTVTPTFGVATKEGLNANFTWGSFGETANEPEQTVTENNKTYKVKVRNFRGYVAGKPAYVRFEEKDQVVTIDGVTLATTSVDAVKAVDMVASAVAGNNVTLTPQVEVTLSTDDGVATKAMVGEAKTYTIENQMVGTYVPETTQEYEPEVVNGRPVVHEYDVTDGVRTFKQDYPYTPNKNLVAKSAKDMYGENYSTVYNGTRNVTTNTSTNGYWTVENTKGQVYSTLSNGVSSDDNIADYGYDSKMTFKKGNYSYTFVGTSTFANSTDALKDAGTKTISGITYNVSDYKENFNMVYTIDGTTIDNPSDAVKRQILVEEEVEDIVPGTILSVDVRAVAAVWNDDLSKYINTDGHLDKIKGLAIVTKEHKGTYIPFAGANDNVALPSDDAIKNANYVERSYYDANYVAGYDTDKSGNWQLATVEDKSNQVLYKDNGTAVRSLTEKSMNTWGWSKSEQNSKVDGYKIEVKDGICTIYFNNKLVKRFK